jgi:NDP-sugar pyrophosphorylase family protein
VNGQQFLHTVLAHASTVCSSALLLAGRYRSNLENVYGSQFGDMRVSYCEELEPLGTAGSLQNAKHLLEERFLLLNGDSTCRVLLQSLLDFHSSKSMDVTVTGCRLPEAIPYGVITQLGDSLSSFQEESCSYGMLINAGIYAIDRKVLSACSGPSLEADCIPRWMSIFRVGCFLVEQPLVDIGTPEAYERTCRMYR